MISTLRRDMKNSKVLWVIVFVGLIGGMGFGKFSRSNRPGVPVLAKINGTELYVDEYQKKLNDMRRYYQYLNQQYGFNFDIKVDPSTIFEGCVSEIMLDQASKHLGLSLNDDVVNEEIAKTLPKEIFDQNGRVDMHIYQTWLNQMGMKPAEFEEKKRSEVMRNLLTDAVKLSAYQPQFARELQSNDVKKSFGIVRIPLSDYQARIEAEDFDDAQLQEYYNEHCEKYRVSEKRKAQYIIFTPDMYAEKVSVDDETVETYYNRKKAELYTIPAIFKARHILLKSTEDNDAEVREKAQELYDKLKEDTSLFAQLAKKNSDDSATAKKGGVLDPFSRGTHNADFEKEVAQLSSRQLAPLFKTEEGYEIVMLDDKEPFSYKPLEDVRDEIVKSLKKRKIDSAMSRDAQSLVRSIKRSDITLGDYAQEQGLEIQTTNLLEKKTPASMTEFKTAEQAVGEKLFENNSKRAIGYVEYKPSNGIVVFAQSDKQESFIPSLESIANKVSADFVMSQAHKLRNGDIAEMRRAFFQDATALEHLSKDRNLKYVTTDLIDKEGKISSLGPVPGLISKAFVLDDPKMLLKFENEDDAYLVQLLEAQGADDSSEADESSESGSKDAKKAQETQKTLEDDYLQGFIASMRGRATIEMQHDEIVHPRDNAE